MSGQPRICRGESGRRHRPTGASGVAGGWGRVRLRQAAGTELGPAVRHAVVVLLANTTATPQARLTPIVFLSAGGFLTLRRMEVQEAGTAVASDDVDVIGLHARNGISVLVVGSGIGGLSAARELWRIGCDVTVLERQPSEVLTGQMAVPQS